jgi:hypothetical protein
MHLLPALGLLDPELASKRIVDAECLSAHEKPSQLQPLDWSDLESEVFVGFIDV